MNRLSGAEAGAGTLPSVSGWWSAIAFLTRLPVPRAQAGEAGLDAALPWFPLVGVILGGLLALADVALTKIGLEPLVVSAVLVVLLVTMTGALHADGLMDTADAVLGHATPERRLEIMRDPRSGAFGVVSVVCVLLLKLASVEALPAPTRTISLVLAPTLGRWGIVVLASAFPAGRSSGLGYQLKQGASAKVLALASLVPLAACALAWPTGPLLGAMALGLALALGRWLCTMLPGLTGDCYGAGCELIETAVWLAAAPLARAFS